jgi:hypothetical protein
VPHAQGCVWHDVARPPGQRVSEGRTSRASGALEPLRPLVRGAPERFVIREVGGWAVPLAEAAASLSPVGVAADAISAGGEQRLSPTPSGSSSSSVIGRLCGRVCARDGGVTDESDRTVASGSMISDGGAMLVSPHGSESRSVHRRVWRTVRGSRTCGRRTSHGRPSTSLYAIMATDGWAQPGR